MGLPTCRFKDLPRRISLVLRPTLPPLRPDGERCKQTPDNEGMARQREVPMLFVTFDVGVWRYERSLRFSLGVNVGKGFCTEDSVFVVDYHLCFTPVMLPPTPLLFHVSTFKFVC